MPRDYFYRHCRATNDDVVVVAVAVVAEVDDEFVAAAVAGDDDDDLDGDYGGDFDCVDANLNNL